MRHRPRSWFCRGSRLGAKPVVAVVIVGVLAGALTSCSTSPPAAIVNGQTITQSQLNAYLEAWAGSPAYVKSYDQAAEQQYAQQLQEAQSEGQSTSDIPAPAFVEGGGSGPDVYDLEWAETEVRQLVTELAVQQYVAKHHEKPSPLELAASWASQYGVDPSVWLQIDAQARAGAALWDADHALIDPKSTNPKEDKQFYQTEQTYFWSRVCVTTVDISVENNGRVDMAASKKQAVAVANELSGLKGGQQVPVTSGARYCLSPEQAIEQPQAFRQLVGILPTGQAAQLPESFGYEVVQVTSRTTIPYNDQVGAIIDIVAIRGENETTSDPKLSGILSASKVEVNSAYPGL